MASSIRADFREAVSSPTPSPDDGVVLADVDPDSPERGRLFPLHLEWNPEHRVLTLRPVRGIALYRSRRYAAAITSELHAADGSPLGASELFRDARGGARSDDPIAQRVSDEIEPALDEVACCIGVERRRIVVLASFTTEDVTADVARDARRLQGGPALEAHVDRRLSAVRDRRAARLPPPRTDPASTRRPFPAPAARARSCTARSAR